VYERHRHTPLSRVAFAWRLARHAAVALLLMGFSLGIGMAGYSHYESLQWRDAFLNAAMLLGGMGPVHIPATPAGKIFAGLYALYAGLIFLVMAGVLLAPVMHRVLHRFHWEDKGSR
jgi:hypothetical protein